MIGTAIPHGILYGVSERISKSKSQAARIEKAQRWFIFNRLLDDYTYHSIVRPIAQKMIREKGWNPYRLTVEQTGTVKAYCLRELRPLAKKISPKITDLTFDLPWNRTFEAEIDFGVASDDN